jgi:membrane protease YdiL (CAAX protease family)
MSEARAVWRGPTPVSRRVSLGCLCAAMVLAVGLKPHPEIPGAWPAAALAVTALVLAWRDDDRNWWRTVVLLTYLIGLLHFTRIDGDTHDAHVRELVLKLGVGCLVVPALAARFWLREPLDYQWLHGRWSARMVVWLGLGFLLAFGVMWTYFNVLTPTLHHSWPLPPADDPTRTAAMWRLFWGCNFVGFWDELCFVNFVFVVLHRRFEFRVANVAQAVFFTSFLYAMAFRGWGPLVIFLFALMQGFTYERTRSLLYIVLLHLAIDSILFFMIANRWYPGWGWHPA